MNGFLFFLLGIYVLLLYIQFSCFQFFHEIRHQGNSVQDIFTRLKQLDVAQYRPNKHEGCIGKIIEEIKVDYYY